MAEREPFHKVRSVRLVAPDDGGYVAAMAEQALAHRRYGPREETSATYRISGHVETAVRGWLSLRVPLIEERVVEADVLYHGARSYETLYLELDAVEGAHGIPSRVYEVKFTSNPAAIRRGFRQLARARHLLEARFERIGTAVVLVQADRGLLEIHDPNLHDVTVIAPEALLEPRLPALALLCLDVGELGRWLSEDELALLQHARDESDANVLARLDRAARLEAGEHLPPPPRHVRQEASLTFGDNATDTTDESPFASLRDLAGRDASERG